MSWLEESVKRSKKLKDHYMLKGIDIFIKDQLPQEIDIDFVIRYVAKRLPDHVLRNIDIIYVGLFHDLVVRDVTLCGKTEQFTSQTIKILKWI